MSGSDRLPPVFRWPIRFCLAAAVAWCMIPLSPSTVDSDFWGHVQYGRDTLRFGVPETSTYNYTAIGYPWINHENLAEITFALCVDNLGAGSVLWLKAAMAMLVLGLMLWNAKRNDQEQPVDFLVLIGTLILCAISLSFYWGMRPQFFSFTLFAVMIWLCETAFHPWRSLFVTPDHDSGCEPTIEFRWASSRSLRLLLLVPVVLWIWANSHGGFLAGLFVFGAILAGRMFESIVWLRRLDIRLLSFLAGIGVVSALATLVNPYGIELHLWLFRSLGVPRPEILEWHPTNLWSADAWKIWTIIGVSATGFLLFEQKRDWIKIAVMSLVLYQTLQHQRHLPFLVILFGMWTPTYVTNAFRQLGWSVPLSLIPEKKQARLARTLGFAGAFLAVVFTFKALPRFQGVWVDRTVYPVSALEYMQQHDIYGKVVVSAEWAQYVLAVSGARSAEEAVDANGKPIKNLVAFDGRFRTCYPQKVVDMHFDFLIGPGDASKRYRGPESPPADARRVLRFESPDLALISRSKPHSVAVMSQMEEDWVRLYQDSTAEVWGRRDRFDNPELATFVPLAARYSADQLESGRTLFPAAPESSLHYVSQPLMSNQQGSSQ
ncbi:MAG: hypothetical protein R3C28_03145 [Pirellulaceae bacterium]